jgi:hypothetical protein
VKLMKMLGLAAAATIGAMALIGSGSASAVTLCRTNESPCAEKNRYQEATLEGALATETSSIVAGTPQVTCGMSNVTIPTGASANPLMGEVTGLTFGGCQGIEMEACVQAATTLPFNAATTATGGGNGVFAVTSGGSGTPRLKVYCAALGLTCIFATGMEGMELGFTGGNPATLVANEEPLTRQVGSSPGCSEAATWSATYSLTPTPLFVASSP